MTGVLTAGDCSEALLSSCVPYLKLDPLVVDEDLFDFEVNPGGTRTVSTCRVTSEAVLLSTLQPIDNLQKCIAEPKRTSGPTRLWL